MKNQYNLQEFNLINESDKKYSYSIYLFFIIVIVIILCKFNFSVYEKNVLFKENDDYYLVVNSLDNDYYLNNKYIYIDNKKYKYKISKIDTDFQNINNNIFNTIHLDLIGFKSNNIVSRCLFLRNNNTIFNSLIKFIRGG